MTAFLDRRLDPLEFQAVIVPLFKSDVLVRPHEIYILLNEVFLTVEAFDVDDGRSEAFRIDEPELRRVTGRCLASLQHAVDA